MEPEQLIRFDTSNVKNLDVANKWLREHPNIIIVDRKVSDSGMLTIFYKENGEKK